MKLNKIQGNKKQEYKIIKYNKNWNQHHQPYSTCLLYSRINYKAWILQLLIWNAIVIVAKVILFCIEYLLQNVLDVVSKFLLGWI